MRPAAQRRALTSASPVNATFGSADDGAPDYNRHTACTTQFKATAAEVADAPVQERQMLDDGERYQRDYSGYMKLQSTGRAVSHALVAKAATVETFETQHFRDMAAFPLLRRPSLISGKRNREQISGKQFYWIHRGHALARPGCPVPRSFVGKAANDEILLSRLNAGRLSAP